MWINNLTYLFLYGYYIQMTSNIHFTPVPRARERADGWTPEKQAGFIEALSETGTVTAATDTVGMGSTSAYNLRKEPGAASFAEAWDSAQRIGFARLQDIAMDRAINGVAVPHYYKGEMVGEGRWYDNRLLMFMMRQTQTRRYGPLAAEYDFADEMLAAERERDARLKIALEKARHMIDALNAMINDKQTEEDDEMPELLLEDLCEKRDRLESIARDLIGDDAVKAVDFYGSVSPGAIRDLYRKKRR